jgi:hypothetical protein
VAEAVRKRRGGGAVTVTTSTPIRAEGAEGHRRRAFFATFGRAPLSRSPSETFDF